jgi:hypothetical protein
MANQSSWTTIHTDNRMIHDFGGGYRLVVDKTTNQAEKQHNGHPIGHFDTTGMLLETFEQILTNFSETKN